MGNGLSAAALNRYTTFTPSTGVVAEQAIGDKTIHWTGIANSVTFTVGVEYMPEERRPWGAARGQVRLASRSHSVTSTTTPIIQIT